MKKLKNIFVLSGVILFSAFISCNEEFLQKPVQGALGDEVLANKAGVEKLLVGAYALMDGIGAGNGWEGAPDNWIYGSIAGGDAHKGSFGGDLPAIDPIVKFIADGSNNFFNIKWKVLYNGVTASNSVLIELPLAKNILEADRKNIEAQARFLRGHFYFELKKMFNMVPWIDEATTDFNQPNDVDIWPKIEADFKFAFDNLPPIQAQVGRANKWAAGSYLGKTYLYQKKYSEAIAIFDQVISEGQTSNGLKYGLVEKFEDNFDAATKNNKESVFAIQMTANNGTNSVGNSNQGGMICFPGGNAPFRRSGGYHQPSQELVNSYRTDASGLPLVDAYNQAAVKNDMGLLSSEEFTPDGGNLDPRLDWTVGRRGIPFHDWGYYPGASWVLTQSYSGPYGPKKNVYWQATQDIYADQSSWAPGTAINVLVIRFADVLLMAAEAHANAGSLVKAQEYVNLVRARAANKVCWLNDYKDPKKPLDGFSNLPAANYVISIYPAGYFDGIGKDRALKAIYFERKLELAMEGHRFFDLVRWGIAETALNNYFNYEGTIVTDIRGGKFMKGRSEYYPIPNSQIDLSKTPNGFLLKQNPGYN
ncbi:outer membrane protein [Aquipluma nitroreducens]|uniref:Outer membrane protein n=1 Tax=Aquipluma nitroreducens TaxID=2010828 RepID=A0A5K7SFP5_9BACT|nr:RagB/SusD family nutrient uptake outer membrane protein [Aquipluma nitroreducens]BBE20408.1 outer membrane protein [Aquipluma nitroreducens]